MSISPEISFAIKFSIGKNLRNGRKSFSLILLKFFLNKKSRIKLIVNDDESASLKTLKRDSKDLLEMILYR